MFRRYLSVFLAVMMAAALCMVTAAADEPYHVTVLVRSFADDQAAAHVEEAINAAAMEELNMSVDVVFVSFGNAANQIQLMLSGGEDLDVTYVPGGSVAGYVNAGYLIDISEYDLSGIVEALGEDVVNACRTADGSIYNMATFKEHTSPAAVIMRKDICDELGIDPEAIRDFDDLTAIFESVKAAYPTMDMIGNDLTSVYNSCCDSLGGDFLGVLNDAASSLEVGNVFDNPTLVHAIELMYQWNQAGYVRADLSTSTESKETVFAAGNTFCYIDSFKPDSVAEKSAQTGYAVYAVQLVPSLVTSYNTTVTGYAVAQNSRNPQKAVEFLNWMYTSPKFNNLINWGVEGVDYEVIDAEKGIAFYPEGKDASSVTYHQGLGWNYPNQSAAYIWKGNDPTIWEQYKSWEGEAIKSVALGCTFDTSDVINEVAACNSVLSKYKAALLSGEVDPAEYLPKVKQELEAAGIQEIINLKQETLNAWSK